MGQQSFAVYLSAADKKKLDDTLAAYQYRRLEEVLIELAGQGIRPSRSALGRYMKAERDRRDGLPVLDMPTTITIVDCRTGRAEVVHSALSAEEIRQRIGPIPSTP